VHKQETYICLLTILCPMHDAILCMAL
jgi:hypothetical protein